MLTVVVTMVVVMLIPPVLLVLWAGLGYKGLCLDREAMSPFECGFDPRGSGRLPFSIRFFLIAVIFLIFDVEIALLLPLASTLGVTSFLVWVAVGLTFVGILLLGVYHEWGQGALDWS